SLSISVPPGLESGEFGEISMRSARFEHLLAGTAIALALALTSYSNSAFAAPDKAQAAAPATDKAAPAKTDAPAADTKAAPKAEAKPATEVTSAVSAPESTKAASADSVIVDKLRDGLASGKFDRILGGKKERTDVAAFYATRDNAPL